MTERPSGTIACAGCGFWRRAGTTAGTCRRYAPAPGDSPAEVTHWPETEAVDGCGEGIAVAALAHALVACHDCRYWRQPAGGHGIHPVDQRDVRERWWQQAGYCARHAPRPSEAPGHRGLWRATNAHDGCAEGETTAP